MTTDIDTVIADIHIELAAIEETAQVKLNEYVNKVFLISTENFCPVDKGNLKASAKITDIPQGKRISYGGDSSSYSSAEGSLFSWGSGELLMSASITVDYALVVHERLDIPHYNPPGACPKFLERAVTETHDDLYSSFGGSWAYGN